MQFGMHHIIYLSILAIDYMYITADDVRNEVNFLNNNVPRVPTSW